MKLSKKASITISLSWVFMIIVGTFFIMLAYNVIAKYKANEDIKYEIELKQTLRSIFNNFGRTAGIEENSIAPLGNIFRDSKVEIICNDGDPLLSINEKLDSNNNYLQSYPTFMTQIQQGKIEQSYMVIESFRMPFKITTMLGLVSKKNLIVLDNQSIIGQNLFKKFKRGSYSELNFRLEDFSSTSLNILKEEIKDDNLNSVVFVTDSSNTLPINLNEINSLSYLIQIDEQSEHYGTITYTNKQNSRKSFNYIDYDKSLSLQTMAVFSTPETFECSYQILLNSIYSSYSFYINKNQYYYNYPSLICVNSFSLEEQKYLYDELNTLLTDINSEIKTNKFNNMAQLDTNIVALSKWHLKLEENSCPYIY